MQQLDTGVLKKLMSSNNDNNKSGINYNHPLVDKPILQVLNIRNISSSNQTNDRYLLLLSDGEYFESACLLLPSLNNLIKYEKLKMNSIIRLDKYAINSIQNGKVLIIVDLTIILLESKKLGNPVALIQQQKQNNKKKLNLIKLTKKEEIIVDNTDDDDDYDDEDDDITHECDDNCCGHNHDDDVDDDDEEDYDEEDEECDDEEDDCDEEIEEICKCNNCQDKNTLKLCYKMLGLSETATKDQVRSKYLSLVTEHKEKVKSGDPKQTEKFDLMTKAFSLIMGIKGDLSDDDNESSDSCDDVDNQQTQSSQTTVIKGTCNGVCYSASATVSVHQDDNQKTNNNNNNNNSNKSKVKIPLEDFLSYAWMRAEHEYGKIKIERCYETDSDNSEHSCEINGIHRRKNRNPKAFYQQMKKSNKTLSIKAMKKRAEKVSNLHHNHHHLHQHILSSTTQQTQIFQNELSSPSTDIHNTNYWKSRKQQQQQTMSSNNAWNDTNNINMSTNSTQNSPNGNKISLKINKITTSGEGKITCVTSTNNNSLDAKKCDFNSKQFNYIFISDEIKNQQPNLKDSNIEIKLNKSKQQEIQQDASKDEQLLSLNNKKSKKKKNKKKNKQKNKITESTNTLIKSSPSLDQIKTTIKIPSDVAVCELAANLENITSEFTKEDTQENKNLKEKLKNIVNSLQTLQKVIDNQELLTKLTNNSSSSSAAVVGGATTLNTTKTFEENKREQKDKINDIFNNIKQVTASSSSSSSSTANRIIKNATFDLSSSELKKSHESLLNELIQTKNEINLQLVQHQNNSLNENDSVKSLSSLATKTLNNIEKITKLSEQKNVAQKSQKQQLPSTSNKQLKLKNQKQPKQQPQKQEKQITNAKTQPQKPQNKNTKKSSKKKESNSNSNQKQIEIKEKTEINDEEPTQPHKPEISNENVIASKPSLLSYLARTQPINDDLSEQSNESDSGDWIQVKKPNRNESKQTTQQHPNILQTQKVQSITCLKSEMSKTTNINMEKKLPAIASSSSSQALKQQQKQELGIASKQVNDSDKNNEPKVIKDLIPKSLDEEEIMLKKALELSLKQTQEEEEEKQKQQKPTHSKAKKFDCIDDFTSEIEKVNLKQQKSYTKEQEKQLQPQRNKSTQSNKPQQNQSTKTTSKHELVTSTSEKPAKKPILTTSSSSYVNGISYAAKSAKKLDNQATSNSSSLQVSNSFSNFTSVDEFPPVTATLSNETNSKPFINKKSSENGTMSTSKSAHQIPIQTVAPIVIHDEQSNDLNRPSDPENQQEKYEDEEINSTDENYDNNELDIDPFVKSLSPNIVDPLPYQQTSVNEIKPQMEVKAQPSAIVAPTIKKQTKIIFGHCTKQASIADFKDNGVDLPIDQSLNVPNSLATHDTSVDSPIKRPIGSERPIGAERPIGYKTNLPTAIVAPSRANIPSAIVPPLKVEPIANAEPGLLEDFTFSSVLNQAKTSLFMNPCEFSAVKSSNFGFNSMTNGQSNTQVPQASIGFINGTNGKVKLVNSPQPMSTMMYNFQQPKLDQSGATSFNLLSGCSNRPQQAHPSSQQSACNFHYQAYNHIIHQQQQHKQTYYTQNGQQTYSGPFSISATPILNNGSDQNSLFVHK